MAGEPPQNKTNILFLISDMRGGGAQRVASLLCNAWVERGDQVTLVTYEAEDTESFYALSEKIDQRKLDLVTGSHNVFLALRSNFKRIMRVQKIIKETQPDVVLCFGAEVTVIGVMAALGLDVKIIGSERTDPSRYPTGIWGKLRNFAYPKVSKLVVQTNSAAEFCTRFHKDISIIPNPVVLPDLSETSDISKPAGEFISSLGRLSEEKGHDLLIRAFAQIAKDYKDLDLLLIGDGPKRQDYQDMASDLDIAERVHFAGQSKNPFPVLQHARIFVLPSRFEGFPNALVEAMALGLPCLSTKGTIGAETVIDDGRNGLLVEAEDPDAMAAALRNLLDNAEWAQKLGEAAGHDIPDKLSLDTVLSYWDKVIK
ncbi:MAG: glycosyltransferase family 4 protein [Pseudomonadota bacterium]